MGKTVFIAEKPSVAKEFAKALNLNTVSKDGYLESQNTLVTWCVGHLVTMSYPEAYDPKYKKWTIETLPFIPSIYKYEVIEQVKKQFQIVKNILTREEVETIYVCTDSGREGEYIYRLVEQMVGVHGKTRKRVWIDSQTQEEIIRGIKEAKDLSEYDALSASAYLRAKEDYLMGINFSRVLTLKYGNELKNFLKVERISVSVGRVMTCVLGMVVQREREIRDFVKTPFYKVQAEFVSGVLSYKAEWRVSEQSSYFGHPDLYKDNGFTKPDTAQALVDCLQGYSAGSIRVESVQKKKETKNPPLLYNLAELQNDCAKLFKISPDETLKVVQELYEKKMVTYPRTDARVLSTAVAKEIHKNIQGLQGYDMVSSYAQEILTKGLHNGLAKTRYVNDKMITDHYAIIPTGQGAKQANGLSNLSQKIYEIIVKRFLSIFFLPAVYNRVVIMTNVDRETFYSSFKVLVDPGYLTVAEYSFSRKKDESQQDEAQDGIEDEMRVDASYLEALLKLKKGTVMDSGSYFVKDGETSPPKRFNSGNLILAMENAGQLIDEEELRAQIKGSGIGTSATRAEILKKLVHIQYLSLNTKTQIIAPTILGELIYEIVDGAMNPLLKPALTASWEKGLSQVAQGQISEQDYLEKLHDFVSRRTNQVKVQNNQVLLHRKFEQIAKYYNK